MRAKKTNKRCGRPRKKLIEEAHERPTVGAGKKPVKKQKKI
jgi:hypothetical protein